MDKAKFIISKEKVFNQVKILKEVFDEVSYSWKTNPTVGKLLSELGVSDFSVHSINELNQIFEMTGDKNVSKKIWYFPLAVNEEDLNFIFKKNIRNFILDNLEDLEILLNYIQSRNIKINLLLRMKLKENTIFTGKHYVFGVKVNEIKDQIPKLRKNKNIEKLGIHVHRKTQNVSEWNLRDEIENSLGKELLSQINILNLGGGLPANYKNIHDNAIESIFTKITELKKYTDAFGIKMYIEPGRFVAAPSVRLESEIIAIHDNTCFLNVSIFNGMMDTVLANIKLHVEGELEKGKRYLLKGLTPDSTDILRYSVYLDSPKVGDKITFLNCGAYTYTTNFCALEKIEEVIED